MSELGIHKARAIAGSEQFSPDANGNLIIGLDMQLDDGQTMTVTFPFAGKAPEYSMKKLRMLGWTGDDVTELTGIGANEVDVRVYEETYDGKTQLKCEIVYGGGAFKFKSQLDDRGKKAFAAQLRGLAKSIPAAPGSGTTARSSNGHARKATGTSGGPPDRDFAIDNDANDDIGF